MALGNPEPCDIARGSRGCSRRDGEDAGVGGVPGDDASPWVELRRQLPPVDAHGGGGCGETEVDAQRLLTRGDEDRQAWPHLWRDQVGAGRLPAVDAVVEPCGLRLNLDPGGRGRYRQWRRGRRRLRRPRPGQRRRHSDRECGDERCRSASHERRSGGATRRAPTSKLASDSPA